MSGTLCPLILVLAAAVKRFASHSRLPPSCNIVAEHLSQPRAQLHTAPSLLLLFAMTSNIVSCFHIIFDLFGIPLPLNFLSSEEKGSGRALTTVTGEYLISRQTGSAPQIRITYLDSAQRFLLTATSDPSRYLVTLVSYRSRICRQIRSTCPNSTQLTTDFATGAPTHTPIVGPRSLRRAGFSNRSSNRPSLVLHQKTLPLASERIPDSRRYELLSSLHTSRVSQSHFLRVL